MTKKYLFQQTNPEGNLYYYKTEAELKKMCEENHRLFAEECPSPSKKNLVLFWGNKKTHKEEIDEKDIVDEKRCLINPSTLLEFLVDAELEGYEPDDIDLDFCYLHSSGNGESELEVVME